MLKHQAACTLYMYTACIEYHLLYTSASASKQKCFLNCMLSLNALDAYDIVVEWWKCEIKCTFITHMRWYICIPVLRRWAIRPTFVSTFCAIVIRNSSTKALYDQKPNTKIEHELKTNSSQPILARNRHDSRKRKIFVQKTEIRKITNQSDYY